MRAFRLSVGYATVLVAVTVLVGCRGADDTPPGLWPRLVPAGERIQIQLPLSVKTDGLKGKCLHETVHWQRGGGSLGYTYRGHKECIPTDAGTAWAWHTGKPVRTAERPGFYEVHVTYSRAQNEVLRTSTVQVMVVPKPIYCLVMALLLIAVFYLFYWTQPTEFSEQRWIFLTALVLATLPIWLPLIFGRTKWFIVLAAILGLMARRYRGPELRAAWSVAYIIFLEWYWGVCTSDVSLHGFIISTSVMGGLMLAAHGLIRNRSAGSWTMWSLTVLFALLYSSMAVYDSFFQDFPSATTFEFVAMAGAVDDSIWSLVQSDHLLTVLLAVGLAVGPKERALSVPASSPK